eukprot:6264732-Pyramimonas_sp.AAC.1
MMRGHQTAPLAPGLQQQHRLPPNTSSHCIPKSRSRAGLPHNVYRNRAPAWDFLAICSNAAPSTLRNHAHALAFLIGNRAIARNFLNIHAGRTLQQPARSTWPPGPAFPAHPS